MSDLAGRIQGAAQGGAGRSVFDLLDRQKDQIAVALPRASGLTPERFSRIVATEIRRTPALAACDPMSIIAGSMLGAQLGLEAGPLGHFYLVPFKEHGVPQAVFILGYKGMIALAWRGRQLASIVAREVYERDEFEYEYGVSERIRHKPATGERGAPTVYYGVAHFKSGGHLIHVMERAEVEKFRARSRARDKGPWVTDYDAMAKKTVIRRMWSYLPMSSEAARAAAADESVATDLSADMLGAVEAQAEEVESGGSV